MPIREDIMRPQAEGLGLNEASAAEIEGFIQKFARFGPQVRKAFTQGCCYWFAKILADRFPGSVICYIPQVRHFATLVSGRLYDITGNVSKKYEPAQVFPWAGYRQMRPKDAARAERECVRMA